ncbi:MAG: UDP-N-acetylmuramoyl-L-alanine--D-glutamate ligase [Clostridia bacterium]
MMNKKALIVGWGESGKGSALLLQKKGYDIFVYDDAQSIDCKPCKDVSKLSVFEAVADKDLVVISPSICLNHKCVAYAKSCKIEVVGELELGYKYCHNNIVAITGTNGKTTTTMLMSNILTNSGFDSRAVGNIGKSFCRELCNIGDGAYIVLEVSSFQLEGTKTFRPNFAICLNLSPDHIERHVTFENYAEVKKRIFANQTQDDYSILNYDDDVVKNFVDSVSGKCYFFSLKHRVKGVYLRNNEIIFEDEKREVVCSVDDMWSNFSYNISNAMPCILVAKLLGIDNDTIKLTLKNFKPPKYRLEHTADIGKRKIFNDSKATNIDSTLKACGNMQGSTALIVGGYNKGISYESFFTMLPSCVRHIVGCGENVYDIMQFMPQNHLYSFEVTTSLERAVELVLQKDVDNILFSPTTSSYDRYTSYVQRGEHFDRIINQIANEYPQNQQ